MEHFRVSSTPATIRAGFGWLRFAIWSSTEIVCSRASHPRGSRPPLRQNVSFFGQNGKFWEVLGSGRGLSNHWSFSAVGQNRAFPCIASTAPRAGTPGGATRAPIPPQSCAFVVTIAHDEIANPQKAPGNDAKKSSPPRDCRNSFCALLITIAHDHRTHGCGRFAVSRGLA
jgi:hypothetical protein